MSSFSPHRKQPYDISEDHISGQVEHLYHQRPNWCSGKIRVESEIRKFTVKGFVDVGDAVTLFGAWENHPVYGWEFKANSVQHRVPDSVDGIQHWLEWNCVGIGEKKAAKLLLTFGNGVMRAFCEQPERVAAVAGIAIESARGVALQWEKYADRIRTVSRLASFGLTQSQCEAIYRRLGNNSVKCVQSDPYALISSVDGIGWKTADEIAGKMGVGGADPRRLRGAIAAFVREEYANGHTATRVEHTVNGTAELIQVDTQLIREELPRVQSLTRVNDWLATPWAIRCERAAWDFLTTSRNANPLRVCSTGQERRHAESYRQCGAIQLDDTQVQAVENAIRYRISCIHGAAGTGKSSVARAIVKVFAQAGVPIHMCAPTGKAARRLGEIIGDGERTSTIHRLLHWQGSELGFEFNDDNSLFRGLYLVDEVAMCDASLMYHLFTALPEDSCVVLIGDTQQLPPVGPGAVMRDILRHDLAPTTRLTMCHRQAGILKTNCTRILSGVVSPTEGNNWILHDKANSDDALLKTIWGLYRDHLPAWGFGDQDWVFLAPKLDGPTGVKRINLAIQCLHQYRLGNKIPTPKEDDWQRRPRLYPGDRVIQTRNVYDLGAAGIMNGQTGLVREVEPRLVIDYDGERVEYTKGQEKDVLLAYCSSVHRYQGAQVPCAVTIIPRGGGAFVSRNLLYTSVTRAMRTSVIVGDGESIRQAAQRTSDDERRTILDLYAREGM